MSLQTLKNQKGFTIVELLIVIVVIGILAAITIVAFNGIQNRGKSSSAQSAANNAIKKVQIYSTDDTVSDEWPATGSVLTASAANGTTYKLEGASFGTPAVGSAPSVIRYNLCGTGASTPTNLAGITTRTGAVVDYYDYQNSRITTTSTTPASPTAGSVSGSVGGRTVACFPAN